MHVQCHVTTDTISWRGTLHSNLESCSMNLNFLPVSYALDDATEVVALNTALGNATGVIEYARPSYSLYVQ